MGNYRAYLIGSDGHIVNRIDLCSENDEDALREAASLVDGNRNSGGCDIELWHLDRRLATFMPSPSGTDAPLSSAPRNA
jgi:hypothetical protein